MKHLKKWLVFNESITVNGKAYGGGYEKETTVSYPLDLQGGLVFNFMNEDQRLDVGMVDKRDATGHQIFMQGPKASAYIDDLTPNKLMMALNFNIHWDENGKAFGGVEVKPNNPDTLVNLVNQAKSKLGIR